MAPLEIIDLTTLYHWFAEKCRTDLERTCFDEEALKFFFGSTGQQIGVYRWSC